MSTDSETEESGRTGALRTRPLARPSSFHPSAQLGKPLYGESLRLWLRVEVEGLCRFSNRLSISGAESRAPSGKHSSRRIEHANSWRGSAPCWSTRSGVPRRIWGDRREGHLPIAGPAGISQFRADLPTPAGSRHARQCLAARRCTQRSRAAERCRVAEACREPITATPKRSDGDLRFQLAVAGVKSWNNCRTEPPDGHFAQLCGHRAMRQSLRSSRAENQTEFRLK